MNAIDQTVYSHTVKAQRFSFTYLNMLAPLMGYQGQFGLYLKLAHRCMQPAVEQITEWAAQNEELTLNNLKY